MTLPDARPRARLRDVAERAGVSSTTASFVLAGRDMRISEPTRQRVLRAARELDYRPNLTAQALRTQQTRTIALVTHALLTGPYAGDLVRGALTAAVEQQHHLLIAETEWQPEVEATALADLIDRRVQRFVYVTTSHEQVRLPDSLRDQDVVLLNCIDDGSDRPTVVPDETGGGRAAAEVLLEAGLREDIWVLGEVPRWVVPARERLAGVVAGLADADATLAGRLSCEWWPESAYDALAAFLRDGGRPAALICLNDRIAFGAYQALTEAGLRVPDDVSVVSFDDSELAQWLRPAVTSIGLPHFAMGRRAVARLLGAEADEQVERLPMDVRRRGSVRHT